MAALLALAIPASASSADGAARAHDVPQFLPMAPLVVPIVASDHLEGALRLKLVLTAKDAVSLARLTARLPELRAASFAGAIEFSRLFASAQTPVNAMRLRADLTTTLRAMDEGVDRVLIVEVSAEA